MSYNSHPICTIHRDSKGMHTGIRVEREYAGENATKFVVRITSSLGIRYPDACGSIAANSKSIRNLLGLTGWRTSLGTSLGTSLEVC